MLDGAGFEEDEPIVVEVRVRVARRFVVGTVGVRRGDGC